MRLHVVMVGCGEKREERFGSGLPAPICLLMVADLVVPPADLVVAAPATPSSISKLKLPHHLSIPLPTPSL